MKDNRIRAAVVGVGSLGQHHARIYSELPDAELIAVVDTEPSRAEHIAGQYGCRPLQDHRQLFGKVDAVSLAVPTIGHSEIGCELLEQGIHVLVEKPIANTLQGADRLIEAHRKGGAILQVGHSERFNPALTQLGEHLTTPLFFEGHRLGLFVPRSLDVDVLLDLMIHDLDLVLTMAGQPVVEMRSVGIPILSQQIDIANARLEFGNGCVANLTASRVSSEKVRKLRFFQPNQYISIDFKGQETEIFGVEGQTSRTIGHRVVKGPPTEPLLAEINAFLDTVRGQGESLWPGPCSARDGRRALQLALSLLDQISEHHRQVPIKF